MGKQKYLPTQTSSIEHGEFLGSPRVQIKTAKVIQNVSLEGASKKLNKQTNKPGDGHSKQRKSE